VSVHAVPLPEVETALAHNVALVQHAAEEADRLGDEAAELEGERDALAARCARLERQLATERELVTALVGAVTRQERRVEDLLPWAAAGARAAVAAGTSATPWGAHHTGAELLERIDRSHYRRGGVQL
jgi:hypothetical protein